MIKRVLYEQLLINYNKNNVFIKWLNIIKYFKNYYFVSDFTKKLDIILTSNYSKIILIF